MSLLPYSESATTMGHANLITTNYQNIEKQLPEIYHPDFCHEDLALIGATRNTPDTYLFDSDSYQLRINNCCSRTVTFHKMDFVPGTLEPIYNRQLHGGYS